MVESIEYDIYIYNIYIYMCVCVTHKATPCPQKRESMSMTLNHHQTLNDLDLGWIHSHGRPIWNHYA